MFKIGEFSKLSQVPIKTLRYYDEIGLLKPTEVDSWTSYRFYELDQLPRLNRILALKDLGFTLDQIGQMLDGELSSEQLRGMLRMKQAESEQLIDAERARLRRIESRVRQIEMEGKMPPYEIIIKKTQATKIATVRAVVANYSSVGPLFGELYAALGKSRITPLGPGMAIYYDEGYREQDVEVEVAVPVSPGELPQQERVAIRDLPGETVASLVRRGPYDDFNPAYQALMQWIEDNGYCISGPNREIYLRGPGDGIESADFLTEMQFPVRRRQES